MEGQESGLYREHTKALSVLSSQVPSSVARFQCHGFPTKVKF